jgi:hypothetical protein
VRSLSPRRALVPLGVAGAAALLLVVGWRCPIQLLLGLPCPTCGITRATLLALHGDLAAATHLHPLVWLAVPVVAGVLCIELTGYVRTKTWGASRRVRGADALLTTTAFLLFALWIARFAGFFGGPVS